MTFIPISRFTALLFSFFSVLSLTHLQAEEPPNVIFILGDDQAWWDYSFMYRDEVEGPAIDANPAILQVAQTPAIDRLADEGLTFTHGYTVPLCRPSLHAIITGTFPHQNRISGNDFVNKVDDERADQRIQFNQSLARTLVKRQGYRAFQTGKWWGGPYHFGGFTEGDTQDSVAAGTNPPQYTGSRPSYANRGRHGDWGLMIGRVDYVNDIPSPPHPINYANTIVPVTDFIDSSVASNNPFFIWYAPFLPHTPFDPPTGLRNKYDDLIDEPNETADHVAKYYANIERLDGGVGAILDHLDSVGVADNTLIIFICDNGWITRTDTGTRAAKSKLSPYDGGARTPIIVHWPKKIKPGGDVAPQFVTQPVSVIDMVTTALAGVGLQPSAEQLGVNLMNLNQVNAREEIYCDVYDHDMASLESPVDSIFANFIVKDGWKLIDFEDSPAELYHLYNTTTGTPVDPFEENDLSSSEPAKLAQLSNLIDTWYDEPKEITWSQQASQTQASETVAIPAELGQSFTVTEEGFLTAINLPFLQTASSEAITLELRELDSNGTPSGTLLASSTLTPDPIYQNGFRWGLFSFQNPIPVNANQQLGFLVKSATQPNSGFNIAYHNGGYLGGTMTYQGLLEGETWETSDLDLAFQVFTSPLSNTSEAFLEETETGIRISANMAAKNHPVEIETTSNLQADSWVRVATDANLDGIVALSEDPTEERKFYRFALSSIGAPFNAFPADSVTLFEELFAGTGDNLNGTTPDTTTDAAVWAAATTASILDDGSIPAAGSSSANLPFVPEDGFVYTLEATIDQSATDQDRWVSFGFSEANPSSGANQGSHGVLWALTRNFSVNEDQVFHANSNGGTGTVARGDYLTGATPVTMTIILNTTQGTGNWTYQWLVDGEVKIESPPLATTYESAIGSIAISNRLGTPDHRFTSLKLSRE